MSHLKYNCILFILSVIFIKCSAKPADIHLNEISELTSSGCDCQGYSCGCCAHVEAPKVGLNDTACVNITYLPDEYGIHFTMNIDKLVIWNETISVKNPPPICFGAPMLEDYADLCIHFYDLDATLTKLHGCVDVEARLHKIIVAHYKVGCFNIGKSSKNLNQWQKHTIELIEKIRLIKKISVHMI